MHRTSFNQGWTVAPGVTGFDNLMGGVPGIEVMLPHDAIRDVDRSESAVDSAHTGYFPGGYFRYSKTFDVPEDYEGRSVTLEFDGVYRDAVVYVNGDFAAQRPYGYSRFAVSLDAFLRYGEPNTIDVECRAHLDSRWYTGAGIYRDTHLLVGEPVHVGLDGVRVTTADVDSELAVLLVDVTIDNELRATRSVRVETSIKDGDGASVAHGTAPLTILPGSSATAHLRIHVPEPSLWDVESPHLYEAVTHVSLDGAILDEDRTTFGIRSLQLDSERGLRINGRTVNLRGACIHHDNGLLGSAAIARAEERRVEILKEAGFNAIRSAHNPLSSAALDACDRIGMLVVDETFDMWTKPKSAFDYSLAFPEWWERDVEALVAKDYNHPSVVMYSIGNEVFEAGSPMGSIWGRRLAEKVRDLDPTRFVTNAVNGLIAVVDELPAMMGAASETEGATDLNSMFSELGEMMNDLGTAELVTNRTEESLSVLDVAGFNYSDARYVPDRAEFPNRVILGTETFPGHIDQLWELVEGNSHVVGDFTWTGWDYLGEAGIGRTDYPDDEYVPTGIHAPYPAILAGCGDIDITGHRRPVSFYRETVFGLRDQPYMAVHRPQFHGRERFETPWSWADAVSSWSWDVPAGSPITVDVYSDADEIELTLDGSTVGRVDVGAEKAYLARFETSYEPGELTAIAYRSGAEVGRSTLRSAGPSLRLDVNADRTDIRADTSDVAYVEIVLRDTDGNLANHTDRSVSVDVSGPGFLAGIGSARPTTEERFDASMCTTYDGRAMAIVRASGEGEIRVSVSAEGCAPTTEVIRSAAV